MQNKGGVFSQVIKAKYFPSSDYLSATMGHNPSYVWLSFFVEERSFNRWGAVESREMVRRLKCPLDPEAESFQTN